MLWFTEFIQSKHILFIFILKCIFFSHQAYYDADIVKLFERC